MGGHFVSFQCVLCSVTTYFVLLFFVLFFSLFVLRWRQIKEECSVPTDAMFGTGSY